MNSYDSNRILESVSDTHKKVVNPEEADVIVFNTCHIREKAAEKIYSEVGKIAELKKNNKNLKLVVAGCVAQAEGKVMRMRQPNIDLVIGPQMYHDFPILLNSEKEKSKLVLDFNNEEKFSRLGTKRSSASLSSFLTIQEGCNKFCSFCVVPFTRGAEYSRSVLDLVSETKQLVLRGCKELILLGQNVNAYHGQDINGKEVSLAQLIIELEKIPGVERISYTTSHPKDMAQDLIELHGYSKKLNPYLHLPVQSGSDRILKNMNRKYDTKRYMEIIEEVRKHCPDIALSSDFIVGYPGETNEDFRKTIDLIKAVGFSQAYSFKYSSRPGTKASRIENNIDLEEANNRLYEMQDLLNEQQKSFNSKFINSTQEVFFKGRGKKEGQIRASTRWMQTVNFYEKTSFIDKGNVKIIKAKGNSLLGEMR